MMSRLTFALLPAGSLQADLSHLPQRGLLEPLAGELGHHGARDPLCCHSVLCTRGVQAAPGELLRLPGKVRCSVALILEEEDGAFCGSQGGSTILCFLQACWAESSWCRVVPAPPAMALQSRVLRGG